MADPKNTWRGLIPWWVAGLLLGVIVAFVPLAQVALGLVIVILAAIWAALRRPRGVVLSGFLAGLGATWAVLLANATLSCSGSTATEGCVGPDLSGWTVVPATLLVAGLALGLVTVSPLLRRTT